MTTMYARRLSRESLLGTIPAREPGKPVLSDDEKTHSSICLPVRYCQPSHVCSRSCYACQGPIAWPGALTKALAVDRLIVDEPEAAAERVLWESRGNPIRWAGSGDGAAHHLPFLRACRARGIKLWGFTKIPAFWLASRESGYNFMYSLDESMRGSPRWSWAMRHVARRWRTYLRRPKDPDRSRQVYVTFPEHGPQTPRVASVPVSRTDCPAVRSHEPCGPCRLCKG